MLKSAVCMMFLAGCAPVAVAAERPVVAPTICRIIADPGGFDGTFVSLDGMVFAASEYSGIRSPACPDRFLPFRGGPPPAPGYAALNTALQQAQADPRSHVFATVRGTIAYRPGKAPSVVIFVSEFANVRTSGSGG